MWSAKSTKRRSTTLELTVPRLAMVWEISLISSSSIRLKILAVCSSPSESTRIAAFSAPLSERTSSRLRILDQFPLRALVHPGADDRDRFLGVLFDDLADLLDARGAHASLDLADVDHAVDGVRRSSRHRRRRDAGGVAAARRRQCPAAPRPAPPALSLGADPGSRIA